MIDVENLVKWYGPTLAVDRISFQIPEGQIVGFLGPNGAGKTTTLRILTGYLPATSGRASVAGHDVLTQPRHARAQLGYLPESTPLYGEMRVEEYLDYRGRLMQMSRKHRRARIDAVVDRCGLSLVRRRVIGALSKGNRQRVGLAQALLHEPKVLILDEPTAGLDPNQIQHVRQLIHELRGEHTILLSSHILPEVERSADRVLIIAGGRIVAQGSPTELRQKVVSGARVVAEVQAAASAVRRAVEALPGVASVQVEEADGWARLTAAPSEDGRDLREPLGRALARSGWAIRELRHETASLEQFFVQITAGGAPQPTQPEKPEAMQVV